VGHGAGDGARLAAGFGLKLESKNCFFLKKKAAKKTLTRPCVLVSPPVAQGSKSFFGSFFAKKELLALLA